MFSRHFYLRGLLSLRHPLRTAEYVITPVIFRASRIAEELAASAESRGISNLCPHTCRREIVLDTPMAWRVYLRLQCLWRICF